jgi:hypothetical protein
MKILPPYKVIPAKAGIFYHSLGAVKFLEE